MKNATSIYAGYRFPAEVIRHAVWLYYLWGAKTHSSGSESPTVAMMKATA